MNKNLKITSKTEKHFPKSKTILHLLKIIKQNQRKECDEEQEKQAPRPVKSNRTTERGTNG
jgi:hypothetical protein